MSSPSLDSRVAPTAAPAPIPWVLRRRVLSAALVVVLASLQAIPATQLLVNGRDVPLPLAVSVVNFVGVLAVASLVDYALSSRLAALPRLLTGAAAGVLTGGLLAAAMWGGAFPRVTQNITADVIPMQTMGSSFLLGAGMSVLVLGAWSLAVVLPHTLEREKLRELQLTNLKLEAAELRTKAELARLRGQLEPHFLLNTLNTVAGLVGLDAERARRTLVNLGALLRDTLDEAGEERTVAEEIEWLKRYAEILQTRHSGLELVWQVDESVCDELVPRLILQPLIENAILHGALRAAGPGRVVVRVVRGVGAELSCEIVDNGPGPSLPARTGAVGLENVRRRLEITRPGATLRLEATPNGTTAIVRLPAIARQA